MKGNARRYSLLAVPVLGKTQRLDRVRVPTVVTVEPASLEVVMKLACTLSRDTNPDLALAYVNGLRVFETLDWVYYIV